MMNEDYSLVKKIRSGFEPVIPHWMWDPCRCGAGEWIPARGRDDLVTGKGPLSMTGVRCFGCTSFRSA